MDGEQHISELVKALEDAVQEINTSIPAIEREIQSEIDQLLKGLDTKGDIIKPTVGNIKKIAAFKNKLWAIVKRSGYIDSVDKYLDSFTAVTIIQNDYFKTVEKDFTPSKLASEIKALAISDTIGSLTEAGVNSAFINPIKSILTSNSTGGGSFSQLSGQLRNLIVDSTNGEGRLTRYVKQVTTDSLNQYSRQYSNAIASDLGLDWFMYVGAIIKTSRAFCKACVKKKYIHRSEFQQLIDGEFPEFQAVDGKINDKTGLPDGMIDGTNESNFTTYAGGWNCNHVVIPVSAAIVPKYLRDKFA